MDMRNKVANIGGQEIFTATLKISYSKNPTHKEEYNRLTEVEPGANRTVVDVELQSTSLEKLQEKLTAYVGLAEL